MPANVTESPVEVYVDTLGVRLDKPRKTTGYTAWCDECTEGAVNWHGATYPVGYFSAPALEALIEAEGHNDSEHPRQAHIVRVSELANQPEQERVMEPSTEYRGLCLLGGCIMRDGACLNCGALAIHPIRSEGDER